MSDVNTGETKAVVRSQWVRRVRIAGAYLAWSVDKSDGSGEASEIVVYDHLAGREVYRLTGDIGDFDLREDGTVAFVAISPHTRPSRLAWASVAEPRPHVLSRSAAEETQVEMADNRILFEVEEGDWRTTLMLVDLHGDRRRVARFSLRRERLGTFDFDGRHVAWASIRTIPQLGGGYPTRVGKGKVFVRPAPLAASPPQ